MTLEILSFNPDSTIYMIVVFLWKVNHQTLVHCW